MNMEKSFADAYLISPKKNTSFVYYTAGSIETSSREVLSPPHRLNVVSQMNMSQIHDKLNENIEIRNGSSIDAPFSLAGQALEIPNIDAKPRKSILKNGNSVKTETRAPIIADTDGDVIDGKNKTMKYKIKFEIQLVESMSNQSK